MNYLQITFLTLLLSGCTSSLVVLSYIKTGGDVVSYATTDKTINDHILSNIMEQDCSLFHLFEGEPICQESPKEILVTTEPSEIQEQ